MENFIAIKFLNPWFVEALIMRGPWLPRHKAGPGKIDVYPLFFFEKFKKIIRSVKHK